MENPKCENCGKVLEHTQSTHCSDECLFASIKNSQPFMPENSNKINSATNN